METPRPRLFDRLRTGLEEGIQHTRGKTTLRTRDLSLPEAPRPYSAADIKALRDKRHLSQMHLAHILCVSVRTVQSWEQGVRRPNQSIARLLQMIEDPKVLDEISRAAMVCRGEKSTGRRSKPTPIRSS